MAKIPDYKEREFRPHHSISEEEEVLTSLRELISHEMEYQHDTWDNVTSSVVELSCQYEDEAVTCEFTDEILDRKFEGGYGGGECHYFCMWTKTRVYYPSEFDGAISVHSRSRDPDGRAVRCG